MKEKKKKLSPLLEKIRFYFDVLQESSEAYYFVIDFSAGSHIAFPKDGG